MTYRSFKILNIVIPGNATNYLVDKHTRRIANLTSSDKMEELLWIMITFMLYVFIEIYESDNYFVLTNHEKKFF